MLLSSSESSENIRFFSKRKENQNFCLVIITSYADICPSLLLSFQNFCHYHILTLISSILINTELCLGFLMCPKESQREGGCLCLLTLYIVTMAMLPLRHFLRYYLVSLVSQSKALHLLCCNISTIVGIPHQALLLFCFCSSSMFRSLLWLVMAMVTQPLATFTTLLHYGGLLPRSLNLARLVRPDFLDRENHIFHFLVNVIRCFW